MYDTQAVTVPEFGAVIRRIESSHQGATHLLVQSLNALLHHLLLTLEMLRLRVQPPSLRAGRTTRGVGLHGLVPKRLNGRGCSDRGTVRNMRGNVNMVSPRGYQHVARLSSCASGKQNSQP